jgi:hypothetical protein
MTQMEGACKDMKEKLVSAESQTADMIEKADAMQEHRYTTKRTASTEKQSRLI